MTKTIVFQTIKDNIPLSITLPAAPSNSFMWVKKQEEKDDFFWGITLKRTSSPIYKFTWYFNTKDNILKPVKACKDTVKDITGDEMEELIIIKNFAILKFN